MTNEERNAREAIRAALHQYNIHGDANEPDGYAAVFAEDGVISFEGFDIVGRAAIHAWKAERSKGPPAKLVRHNLTTCKIELTGPETARVKTYFFVVTTIGPDHMGYYADQFKKVGEDWLIARRDVFVDWYADASMMRPKGAAGEKF